MTDNRRRRYKPSPLQEWRIEYAYVSAEIRQLKRDRRAPLKARWKVYRGHSRLAYMQEQARLLLMDRPICAAAARLLWERNRQREMVA